MLLSAPVFPGILDPCGHIEFVTTSSPAHLLFKSIQEAYEAVSNCLLAADKPLGTPESEYLRNTLIGKRAGSVAGIPRRSANL